MHTLLSLSSLFLIVLAGLLALALLRRRRGWARRRRLQLVVLVAPMVSLGLALGGLVHFAALACFLGAPPWDTALGFALPVGMGLMLLAALGLGLVRLVLIGRILAGGGLPASPGLRGRAERLAARLGTPAPRLLVRPYARPLALSFGLRRPTIVLSSWMLAHLDAREVEAVLAHELGHAARRDYLAVWLATVLRDAFCYLPTSRAAYRQLQWEKELACDDVAAAVTRRPLSLASALAKVWQHAADGPPLGAEQPLVGAEATIERRIERLLALPERGGSVPHAPLSLREGGAILGLVGLQAANLAVMLAAMGCGPAVRLLGPLL